MDIINRVKQYAGRSMDDKRRPTNANITTRETIEIADYIVELETALRYYEEASIYKSGDVPGHIYALDDSGQTARKALRED